MLKKLCVFLLAVVLVFGVSFAYRKPLFSGKENKVEVYLNSPSSLAQIKSVSVLEYYNLTNIVGESVQIDAKNFQLNEFLDKYSATVKFTEKTLQGVSYYAYSPKIKYKKVVNETLVNLQIHISDKSVKVGSPIIFGSF